MTKQLMPFPINLRIDYDKKLLNAADYQNLQHLNEVYNSIPEHELSKINWYNLYAFAAKKSVDAVKAINTVASGHVKSFTDQDWIMIIAYASMNNEYAYSQLSQSPTIPTSVTSTPFVELTVKHQANFLKEMEKEMAKKSNNEPSYFLNKLNQEYQDMSTETKIEHPWHSYGVVLQEYCQDSNITIEHICSALLLVGYCISDTNYLRQRIDPQAPIVTLTVAIPEELLKHHQAVLNNTLSTDLRTIDFSRLKKGVDYYSGRNILPSGSLTNPISSSPTVYHQSQ